MRFTAPRNGVAVKAGTRWRGPLKAHPYSPASSTRVSMTDIGGQSATRTLNELIPTAESKIRRR